MTVHLLTIEHRHGVDHWVCATEATAYAQLDNYVRDWWNTEFGRKPMPGDQGERREQYFLEMVERNGEESYTVTEEKVYELEEVTNCLTD